MPDFGSRKVMNDGFVPPCTAAVAANLDTSIEDFGFAHRPTDGHDVHMPARIRSPILSENPPFHRNAASMAAVLPRRDANSKAISICAPIPILMYHNVAPVPDAIVRWRGLYVHPQAFAHQMWLLHRLGYTGISMRAAMPYLRGEKRERVVVITFDDGYADNFANALPVLQRHGFSATCYVVSGALGRYNDWDAAKLGVRKPVMTMAQLRAWHASGMEVGAHTHTHPHLSECGDMRLRDEISGCKSSLEDIIGAPVTQFCYPYGDCDERVVTATREAGYTAATTTRRGRARTGMDLLLLPRVKILHNHFLAQFAQRVFTGYEDRRA